MKMSLIVVGAVFDAQGRVLTIRHAGRDQWELPGGHFERRQDIDIVSALARELREEVGVVMTPEAPTRILSVPHLHPSSAEIAGGVDADEIRAFEVFAIGPRAWWADPNHRGSPEVAEVVWMSGDEYFDRERNVPGRRWGGLHDAIMGAVRFWATIPEHLR